MFVCELLQLPLRLLLKWKWELVLNDGNSGFFFIFGAAAHLQRSNHRTAVVTFFKITIINGTSLPRRGTAPVSRGAERQLRSVGTMCCFVLCGRFVGGGR